MTAAEAELAAARRQLVEAQRLARIGSWEWHIPADTVWWSDELYRIYGLEPGAIEPSYQQFLAYVHPDDRADVHERNRKAFTDHEPFDDVKRVVRADGAEVGMRTQGEVVVDEDGQPVRMVGICEDVTDQLRARDAERQLAASEALRRRASDINDEIVQGLVLATARLDAGDVEGAGGHLTETLACAKRIAGELIVGDDGIQPGSLRRSRSAA
ncbi:MAG TPA: PAS domain-containing protein [Solirubrobacteraceae bacterium]|nr:PAS domain-containing protein [Solirubrobacteraceae bacterium]